MVAKQGEPPIAVQVMAITATELREVLVDAASNAREGFFDRFSYVHELAAGNFASALQQGLELLLRCQELAPDACQKLHKGTPFYGLGMAAFLIHDFD